MMLERRCFRIRAVCAAVVCGLAWSRGTSTLAGFISTSWLRATDEASADENYESKVLNHNDYRVPLGLRAGGVLMPVVTVEGFPRTKLVRVSTAFAEESVAT